MFNIGSKPTVMKSVVDSGLESVDSNADPTKVTGLMVFLTYQGIQCNSRTSLHRRCTHLGPEFQQLCCNQGLQILQRGENVGI